MRDKQDVLDVVEGYRKNKAREAARESPVASGGWSGKSLCKGVGSRSPAWAPSGWRADARTGSR